MKKALVIGGSGFAGRHVIRELLEQGFEVHALEHRNALPDRLKINVIKGGIGAIDSKLIRTLRPDLVFHLARPTLPRLRRTGRLIAGRYAAWLNYRLIKTLESSESPPALIFASGSLVYGPSLQPHDEDSPLNPFSYARQYYHGEIPVIKALKSGRIPVKIIRFPWLLGKGSWFEWFYLRTMKKYNLVPLFGDGTNLMEVMDIRDAAVMTVRYAVDPDSRGILNLVTPKPVTQLEFASKVSDLSGFPVRDYREAFPGRLEKEVMQAFTSNIVLTTKHAQLFKDLAYTPLNESLGRIISEYSLVSGPFDNK